MHHRIGALLLGYVTSDGKLIYAGGADTGMTIAELERLYRRSSRSPSTGCRCRRRRRELVGSARCWC
jgi:hypothetical protein